MKGVQILLLLLVFFITYVIVARFRNRILEFIILLFLALLAIIFICFPNLTIAIANFLGVGRGTDLVFYVSTLLFWFVVLKLYIRQRNIEKILTELMRQKAINDLEKHDRPS